MAYKDLSPEARVNRLSAVIIIIMFVLALVYLVVIWTTPSSYSEELTNEFYEDEFGTSDPNDPDFPTEYNYKIVAGSTTDGYTEIRLYSQLHPSNDWVLEREGYADSDNNLYWQTYY